MKKFLIIDANSLIHRAFHALPPLMNKKGQLVNAAYGFTSIFLKALKEIKPDYVACCFDVSRDTFRKEISSDYKSTRKVQPTELYEQFPYIKELLNAFNVKIFELKGYEADDVIGTISKIIDERVKTGGVWQDLKSIIVSGDLDVLQLVDDNTEVYTLKKGISDVLIYNESAVKERFGFAPRSLIDYKALRGDLSDNISGITGIGEKTAMDLIKNFVTIDKMYEYLDKKNDYEKYKEELKTKKITAGIYKKLVEGKKQAYQSRQLAEIVREVPIKFNLESCQVVDFRTEKVVELFQEWNFKSLINKIPEAEKVMQKRQGSIFERQATGDKPASSADREQEKKEFKLKTGYILIDNEEKYNNFIKELKKQKIFALDTETDGLNPFANKLIGMSFAWQKEKAYYLAFKNKQIFFGENKRDPRLPAGRHGFREEDILSGVLADEDIKKVGHNLKFDYEVLESAGFEVKGLYFDTMIASYLLNPGTRQHSLDNLAFVELGYKTETIQELTGEKNKDKIDLSKIPVERVANYSCEDADITWRLYENLMPKIKEENLIAVLEKIDIPLIAVLAAMEQIGIKVDINFLNKMSLELAKRIVDLEDKIYQLAGTKFNVASPLQLKEILFEKLNISTAGLSRIKTGISTAAGELDKLKGRHEIIDLIMEFRELSKLKNTYLDPLPELVDKQDRIHTSFNQTVTATGRLSSSEPNLQNIPIKTELGEKIRQAFVASNGYKLLAADYSQIELRIAASLSGDEKMLKAFLDHRDIHTETASQIFNVKREEVTKKMRREAKVINFGVIYGLGPRGLAEGAGVSYEEAQEFIAKYFTVFNELHDYLQNTIALTKNFGYTETLFGRRRYLPEINATHPGLKAQAERMAINHPIQGTAADLIKMAMINLEKKIKENFKPDEVRMLLQIHDELVFEIKENVLEKAKKIIKKEMENVYKFKAPIEVEIGVGKNWGECK